MKLKHSELYDCSTEWIDTIKFSGLFQGEVDALMRAECEEESFGSDNTCQQSTTVTS
jgi:hypothetical protein